MRIIEEVIIILGAVTGLAYIFIYIPYPRSWLEAPTILVLLIFSLLLIVYTLLADLFLKYLPRSFIVGLGLLVLTMLQALRQLNPITGLGVFILTIIFAKLFPKLNIRLHRFHKIPSLRLKNSANCSKLPGFRQRERR